MFNNKILSIFSNLSAKIKLNIRLKIITIAIDTEINLSLFDLQGRLIHNFVSEIQDISGLLPMSMQEGGDLYDPNGEICGSNSFRKCSSRYIGM